MCVCACHSVVPDSLRPHGPYLTRLLCPWGSPGKNTRVGGHELLRGIFPTRGLNSGLLQCRRVPHHLSHKVTMRVLSPASFAPHVPVSSAWPCCTRRLWSLARLLLCPFPLLMDIGLFQSPATVAGAVRDVLARLGTCTVSVWTLGFSSLQRLWPVPSGTSSHSWARAPFLLDRHLAVSGVVRGACSV